MTFMREDSHLSIRSYLFNEMIHPFLEITVTLNII